MGWYGDRVLPRIVDRSCGVELSHPMRRRTCAGLHGEVVELGFGTGHNVAFYPDAVTRVAAVEPADLAWELAEGRVRASRVPVERVGLDGQSLPLPDASFDAALSTWTLCTIPDAGAALREVRRVLRPGARLHFVEHGLAPDADASVRRWQRRLDPLQQRVFGGCHLTRRIADLVTEAGFTLVEVDRFYEPRTPKVGGATTLGVAATPARRAS